MRLNYLPGFLMGVVFLAGCAETELASHVAKKVYNDRPAGSEGKFKVGDSYRVGGQKYTPKETYEFTETGIASWYGPGFDGKRTASGEVFDKNELTAAHRTLQMPSLVRVTNLENGKSVIVRVNDRGPFKRGRVVDVSQRAAQLLGFIGKGTAKVRLDLLGPESRKIASIARSGRDTKGYEVALNEGRASPVSYTPPAGGTLTAPQPAGYQSAAYEPVQRETLDVPGHLRDGEFFPNPVVDQYPVTPSNIYVQAGSFTDPGNANRLAATLQPLGPARIVQALVNGRQFYRVRLGPVPGVDEADSLLARVVAAGQGQSIIVVE